MERTRQPLETAQAVAAAIRRFRMPFGREDRLHAAVAAALVSAGLSFESERDLGDAGRIDFLVEEVVGVELKVKGSPTEVARQLIGYASRDEILSLVLVTAKARLGVLPERMMGKPIIVVDLWEGGLL